MDLLEILENIKFSIEYFKRTGEISFLNSADKQIEEVISALEEQH